MTPKQEAKSLLEKFFDNYLLRLEYFEAKQCALICVDRMLDLFEDTDGADYRENELQEVKQAIEKL